MACPYFYPVEAPAAPGGSHAAMLPLGDRWSGHCHADPAHPWQPGAGLLYPTCNLGYARGTCSRFPAGDGPDAVRFTVLANEEGSVRLYYVMERDHLPFAHGALEYCVERGALLNPANPTLARQAGAYAETYLRRKAEAFAH